MIFTTAGHIDHGKTALLQALTGTDTTHLPEEKKRGLTIDLGYAFAPSENGILGFIDVPGHQKFLSNMLAGLGGVSYALLVVSAEEGIKPQTVEHLTILNLLQFEQIMLVITKADKVTQSDIDKRVAEIYSQFPQLAAAPLFVTSAHNGSGIAELKAYLTELAAVETESNKPFRYAIDRVFNVKGAGLVVTGTAVAGQVAVGDELFLSDGKKVRVKNIHAQNSENSIGKSGQRLALNLANAEKADIARGHWLTTLSPDFSCERISVKLRSAAPLKESNVVHLYHFAEHITAKLNLLTAKQAGKNDEILAEIILDSPLHIALGDKLILRNGDDSQTVGGATVIEIHSPKRYKRSAARLSYLHSLAESRTLAERVALYLQNKACDTAALMWAEQCLPADMAQLGYQQAGNWLFSKNYRQSVCALLLQKMTEYHAQHNDQLGLTKARLHRIAALNQPETVVYRFIDDLLATGKLAQTRGWLHLPEHKIAFDEQELQIWAKIQPLFAATNQALWVRDIAAELGMDESAMRNLLYKAGKLGYLIPIVKDRFLTAEQTAEFAALIRDFIHANGAISVNQLRDQLNYGRKLTVQLIEYFDRCGFLRRKGNVHLLRDKEIFG